jgi:hypothetical protein
MNALLVAVILALPASPAAQESLEAKRDKKLAEPFVKKADWIIDYDKALAESKKAGKPIFAFFTRSYAPCPPCLQLEGGPLLTDDFVKFSKDYVLFLHVTTQVQGEKYANLLVEKGGSGFPHLVFMDSEGNVLAVHEEARTPEAFSKTGEKAKSFVSLKEKAEKGDAGTKIDFVLVQLSLGHLSAEEAEKRIKAAGTPTPEQQAKFDGEKVNADVLGTVKGIRSEEQAKAAGKKFYEAQKAGKAGPTAEPAMQPYYILMMDAADGAKDVETFEAALKTLKDKFGKIEEAQDFFKAKEKRLEELKKK